MKKTTTIILAAFASLMLIGAGCEEVSERNTAQQDDSSGVTTANQAAKQPLADDVPLDPALDAAADAEWPTFTHSSGKYVFNHPAGVKVLTDNSSLGFSAGWKNLVAVDGPPDVTGDVSDNHVKLAVYGDGRDGDVNYFRGLVDSFSFADQDYSGWSIYRDPNGLYVFRYPPGVEVRANAEGTNLEAYSVHSPPVDGPPDMTVRIGGFSVEFSTYEDFEVEYFKGLVSSFKYLK